MASRDDERQPLDLIAEEFARRLRSGERPDPAEFQRRYPEHAAELRDVLSSVALIEQMKRENDTRAAAIPRQLGDFRIIRELGRGGMGVVYEAEQVSLKRRVALKALAGGSMLTPQQRERFRREAQAAARLHHTNIVPVFGVGEADGIDYYVMQLIEGSSLDHLLPRMRSGPTGDGDRAEDLAARTATTVAAHVTPGDHRAPPRPPSSMDDGATDASASLHALPPIAATDRWRHAARLAALIADALQYAHDHGTLHRDIKPANILIDTGGTPWVADFGLAKLVQETDITMAGDVIGTLRYMAPEQLRGAADVRTDVYSLGLVLYEMLTLRPALDATQRPQLLQQVVRGVETPPRRLDPQIPRDLETIVLKAASVEPDRRYQTASAMARDLRLFIADRPIAGRRPGVAEQLWRWARRNPAVASLASIALLLIVAIAIVSSAAFLVTQRERARAEGNLELALAALDEVFRHTAVGVSAQSEEAAAEPPVISAQQAAMLQQLLAFYSRFAAGNHDSTRPALHAAAAYRRVGEIQMKLGAWGEANRAFDESLRLYRQLLRPGAPGDLLAACAATFNQAGIAAAMTGQPQRATELHRAALEMLRESAAPDSAVREELVRTLIALASQAAKGGRPDDAEPHLAEARRLIVSLPADDAATRRLAAGMYRQMFFVARQAGRREEAAAANQQAIEALEALVAESPERLEYVYELAELYSVVPTAVQGPLLRQSLNRLQEAARLASRLYTAYPQAPQYQALLGRVHQRLAAAHHSAGEIKDALTHAADALALLEPLMELHAPVNVYKLYAGEALATAALCRFSAGEKDAVAMHARAEAMVQQFLQLSPNSAYGRTLSQALQQQRHRFSE